MKNIVKTVSRYRMELFFLSQLFILFDVLFSELTPYSDYLSIDNRLFNEYSQMFWFMVNALIGMLFTKRKILFNFLLMFLLSCFVLSYIGFDEQSERQILLYEGYGYLAYYTMISSILIYHVWSAKVPDRGVILGLMSGYISLGLVGYFMLSTIELYQPGSFSGIISSEDFMRSGDLFYYSYITLLTIGYGEIIPITLEAKRASILIGLSGQFYMVILTAIIVGKYLQYSFNNQCDG